MRKELLPEWAQMYKKKGYDIRLRNGQYILLKITSKRVNGKKYPQPVQEYLGIITKNNGLIERKRKISDYQGEALEYGLSNYINTRFKRSIQRSLYNVSGDKATSLITLGIIQFIYGSINIDYLSMSYISYAKKDELLNDYNRTNKQKITVVSNKIQALLEKIFTNKSDYDLLIASLKQNTIIVAQDIKPIPPSIPNIAKKVFAKYGVKYE